MYTNCSVELDLSIMDENSKLFEIQDIDNINYLPRNCEILGYFYFLKEKLPYHQRSESVINMVAEKVSQIWTKTNIPIITTRHLRKKVEKIITAHKALQRKIRQK